MFIKKLFNVKIILKYIKVYMYTLSIFLYINMCTLYAFSTLYTLLDIYSSI